MEINKEKLKKAGRIIFNILGGVAIVLVVIFLIQYVIPIEAQKSSDTSSYDPDDYYAGLNYSDSRTGEQESSEDTTVTDTATDTQEIKTGQVSMTVDDLDIAKGELENIKNEYGGTITYSYESGEGVDRYVYETLKINADDFEEVFEKISNVDGEVAYSNTDSTDVTEEYVDLESRLSNLKAVETQLLEIMETAETVEDTLAVYTELSDTRTEIEVLEGQIRYLDNQTDYSYITVTFSLSSVGAEISEEEWKPYGVLKDAFRSFVSTLKGFVDVLIWVLVFSPIIIVGVGMYLIATKKSRKSKK